MCRYVYGENLRRGKAAEVRTHVGFHWKIFRHCAIIFDEDVGIWKL